MLFMYLSVYLLFLSKIHIKHDQLMQNLLKDSDKILEWLQCKSIFKPISLFPGYSYGLTLPEKAFYIFLHGQLRGLFSVNLCNVVSEYTGH